MFTHTAPGRRSSKLGLSGEPHAASSLARAQRLAMGVKLALGVIVALLLNVQSSGSKILTTRREETQAPPPSRMSHVDEKIKGEVWDSQVVVMFVLAPSEVTTHAAPRPYYVSAKEENCPFFF